MDKFDIPEPKKIAPQLTAEQRQAMAPIDLLVQYIMPKLWDRVNFLEWAVKAEFHSVRESIKQLEPYLGKTGDLDRAIMGLKDQFAEMERKLAAVQTEEKPKRNSRKKKTEEKTIAQPLDSEPRPAAVDTDISEPVAMSAIAQYDADTDRWFPKVVDGVEITAGVVEMVATGMSSYSTAVVAFIYNLSDSERKVLCDTFPDETMEESDG